MNIPSNIAPVACTLINAVCLCFVGYQHIQQGIASRNALQNRQEALTVLAQHAVSDSCWQIDIRHSLSIGEEVKFPIKGKIPTSCLASSDSKQWAHLEYLDGKLKVSHVFSLKEISAERSLLIKKEKK